MKHAPFQRLANVAARRATHVPQANYATPQATTPTSVGSPRVHMRAGAFAHAHLMHGFLSCHGPSNLCDTLGFAPWLIEPVLRPCSSSTTMRTCARLSPGF